MSILHRLYEYFHKCLSNFVSLDSTEFVLTIALPSKASNIIIKKNVNLMDENTFLYLMLFYSLFIFYFLCVHILLSMYFLCFQFSVDVL